MIFGAVDFVARSKVSDIWQLHSHAVVKFRHAYPLMRL
jgi:hypothetical protein